MGWGARVGNILPIWHFIYQLCVCQCLCLWCATPSCVLSVLRAMVLMLSFMCIFMFEWWGWICPTPFQIDLKYWMCRSKSCPCLMPQCTNELQTYTWKPERNTLQCTVQVMLAYAHIFPSTKRLISVWRVDGCRGILTNKYTHQLSSSLAVSSVLPYLLLLSLLSNALFPRVL